MVSFVSHVQVVVKNHHNPPYLWAMTYVAAGKRAAVGMSTAAGASAAAGTLVQRGQGVSREYVESGQRVGGEWAESVLVRGVFGSKKAHF